MSAPKKVARLPPSEMSAENCFQNINKWIIQFPLSLPQPLFDLIETNGYIIIADNYIGKSDVIINHER